MKKLEAFVNGFEIIFKAICIPIYVVIFVWSVIEWGHLMIAEYKSRHKKTVELPYDMEEDEDPLF